MSTNSVHIGIAAIAFVAGMSMYTGTQPPIGVIEGLAAYIVGRQIVKSTKGV